MTKQLLYSAFIRKKFKKKAMDCFILPYLSEKGEKLKYIGTASIDAVGLSKKVVVTVLLDTKMLLSLYINSTDSEKYKLRGEVELVIKKNQI